MKGLTDFKWSPRILEISCVIYSFDIKHLIFNCLFINIAFSYTTDYPGLSDF